MSTYKQSSELQRVAEEKERNQARRAAYQRRHNNYAIDLPVEEFLTWLGGRASRCELTRYPQAD